MDLEFQHLDLRYAALRRPNAEREKRLMGSLADVGQQLPVVVVRGGDGSYVLVDGYKRVRVLQRLGRDVVRATRWELAEAEALLLERLMRATEADSPLEQGWLLAELQRRFGLGLVELGRRFDKSPSWVSRRLALACALPEAIQQYVRSGELGAHGVAKHIVPLARAKREDAIQLCTALVPLRPSTRQVGEVTTAYWGGSASTRATILRDPGLFLRAQEEQRRPPPLDLRPAGVLSQDLGAIGGIARRMLRRLREGAATTLAEPERSDVRERASQARADTDALFDRCAKELGHAG
jgi:ParB family transcriptional regulator, chromosome partitioning protein